MISTITKTSVETSDEKKSSWIKSIYFREILKATAAVDQSMMAEIASIYAF
jgi:hypothetical protein